ncbi:MAG: PSD1 and planctomycete cytochrome C domain-containing protein [Pirellulaceae bacterium]|nr:PSD1 and planctomycete cytochrome C domain-containing protein [Pirellulaceae bacterium]
MLNAIRECRFLVGLCLFAGTGGFGKADEVALSPEGVKFFEAKIRPALVDNCYRCHSTDGQQGVKGGLTLESREAMQAGGESGPAIVPGNLDESVLWHAINYHDVRMPPKQPLPREVIEDFRKWIEMGAPDPREGSKTVINSTVTPEDIAKGKKFWSFKKPEIHPPQTAASSTWSKNDIDRYVEDKHAEHELKPAADADRNTLLRRLHFDLVGLPPSPDDIKQFQIAWQKNADHAIADVVDNLLQSPQFGERWGRFWLDVARYAESTGKEVDMAFPNAWRYRNYVIDAFNQDKPYDQFIREQVAGDLLPAKNDQEWTEHLIATGFLALGPKALIEQNPRQFQADLIDEQIDTTTRVVLGVSVACARCHDHKFDPIPQTDYYALAGIFQSTETMYGGPRSQQNRQPSSLVILPINAPNPGDVAIAKTDLAELKKLRTEKEAEYVEARRAQRNPKTPGTDPRRSFLNANLIEQMVVQITNKINSVDAEGKPLTFCMGVQEANVPRNARVLVRGEIANPAQEVSRGLVQVLCSGDATLNTNTSGRLEFAQWLTSRDNPLTARVMVNRVWQHLLGQAIVREPENFGASGPEPTHPELLDYLAIRFMDQGWSVKELIRDVALSRVYRLSSKHDATRFESDPENRYIARANIRRLDAEAMRDSMLSVSDQIDFERPKASTLAAYGASIIRGTAPVVIPTAVLLASKSEGQGGWLRRWAAECVLRS